MSLHLALIDGREVAPGVWAKPYSADLRFNSSASAPSAPVSSTTGAADTLISRNP